MKTFVQQTLQFTEEKLTSSPEDSHANHTHSQASDSAKRMSAICGQKCLEQFEKFNHIGSWAKMFSDLLIGQEGWYSTKCKLTWKLKGTKYNRTYFQLFPSTLHTEETESGLLPTPRTLMPIDAQETIVIGNRSIRQNGKEFGANLETLASRHLLPTPMVSYGSVAKENQIQGMNKVKNGKRVQGLHLQDLAFHKMLPTPTARDYKGDRKLTDGKNLTANGQEMGMTLEQSARIIAGIPNATSKTSQLSPQFVMEMMGFPSDWTLLPFLNGEPNQLKQEATQ
jgi:hypothetical protein